MGEDGHIRVKIEDSEASSGRRTRASSGWRPPHREHEKNRHTLRRQTNRLGTVFAAHSFMGTMQSSSLLGETSGDGKQLTARIHPPQAVTAGRLAMSRDDPLRRRQDALPTAISSKSR
jgi:hypothetical protein